MGETGFEPATSWSQTRNHTNLDYPPIAMKILNEIVLGNYLSIFNFFIRIR